MPYCYFSSFFDASPNILWTWASAAISQINLSACSFSSSHVVIARFIENAKRYSEIPELTSEILRIFIKPVEVGERAEKYPRTAPQEVRIYYRDIGLVDELPQSMAEVVADYVPDEIA